MRRDEPGRASSASIESVGGGGPLAPRRGPIDPSCRRTAAVAYRRLPPAHAAALDYASVGLRVVPLLERSKVPRQRDWPRKASVDRRRIGGWFRRWPEGNLGIATGGGIVALDVDPRNGGEKALKRLIDEHGPLPPTAEALTGSGGRHFLFLVPAGHRVGCRDDWRPGIDVKGEGGQLVVEPSVHPGTGREYVWIRHPGQGIAEAPDWLRRELLGDGDRGVDAGPSRRPGGWKAGDADGLGLELVAKFPIPGPGRRHLQMTRAVGSLMGREYGEGLIAEALMGWWGHFHALGRNRTGPVEMAHELDACIRSTCRNASFSIAKGDGWHRARCRQIGLDAGQRLLMKSPLACIVEVLGETPDARKGQDSLAPPHCRSVTIFDECLCNSSDEESFVEALIVHVTHKRVELGESEIRMIDDQVRQIAVERRGADWRPWDNQQMGRLKAKYVTRPGSPASRHELLLMTSAGRPRRGHQPGRPSEYETTGIEALLKPEARHLACDRVGLAA